METKTEKRSIEAKNINAILWVIVFSLLAIGVVANSYYQTLAVTLKVAAWIVLVCVEVFLISKTGHGRKILAFAKDARVELNKVVWPKRQETIQVTMIIAALVVVMSLVMWFIDSVLMWLLGFLTG